MKNILAVISVMVLFIVTSCEKNEITFGSTDVNLANSAEVRLVYDFPLVSTTALNLTRLKYNDQLFSMVSTPLGSVFPNSAAKYHTVPQGNVKVDAYRFATKDSLLAYTNTFTVGNGKFSVYIYNANEAPYVIQDVDVFPVGDPWADTTCYIQFVNLLYKADGVTPFGKLTLKGRRGAGTTANPYVFIDIATCDFKQASALVPYKLVKSGSVSSGTETGLAFTLSDSSGTQLQYYPSSSGALTGYASTGNSLSKGRYFVFHVNGKMGTKYADQAIRLSTFGLN